MSRYTLRITDELIEDSDPRKVWAVVGKWMRASGAMNVISACYHCEEMANMRAREHRITFDPWFWTGR
jgi:hypothetical protein